MPSQSEAAPRERHALSVTATPCQLPQRGSQRICEGRWSLRSSCWHLQIQLELKAEPQLPLPLGEVSALRADGEGMPLIEGRKSPLSHGYAVPALPKGEPTHLRGQMEFTVKLLAALDSAEAEDRVAIASPFGRGVSASR